MCYIWGLPLSLWISKNWINRFVGLASFIINLILHCLSTLGTLSPYYKAFLSPETHSFIQLPSRCFIYKNTRLKPKISTL